MAFLCSRRPESRPEGCSTTRQAAENILRRFNTGSIGMKVVTLSDHTGDMMAEAENARRFEYERER